MMSDKNSPSVLETNILYLAIAFLLITVGAKSQAKEVYTGLLITEYLIILLPVLFYLNINGYSVKNNLRLNKVSLHQAMLVLLIVIFSYPVAVFFNLLGIILLNNFVQIRPNPVPIPSNLKEYVLGFLVIALTPGICEEIMFRGMIMRSYESLGKKKSIIYSAALFGLFHFNLQNLIGPIYLGILFGIIAYKTNSLISTMIGHTMNNTIALTIGYLFTNIGKELGENTDILNMPEGREMMIALVSLGLCALLFGFISYKLIKILPANNEGEIIELNTFIQEEPWIKDMNTKKRMSLIESLPILVVIFFFAFWNFKYLFI